VRLLHGDCVEVMRGLPDNSVDAIVTDPPYGLEFMGKEWDNLTRNLMRAEEGSRDAERVAGYEGNYAGRRSKLPDYSKTNSPAAQAWHEAWAREALRVLKPGGHLLAFGGTRTYHRMACAIEDAGFEIRDSIHWVYGSGFPKSLDVSKAIDKAAGAEREVLSSVFRGNRAGTTAGIKGNAVPRTDTVTAPATVEARRWEGWGTALKPAHEPVVVARKPLSGTVAGNVLVWGTGGLNIDGCRVPMNGDTVQPFGTPTKSVGGILNNGVIPQDEEKLAASYAKTNAAGRWPANVVFDRAAGEALDQQSGTLATNKPVAWKREKETADARRVRTGYGVPAPEAGEVRGAYSDNGGASRFFTQADFGPDDWPFVYQAKPSRKERNAGLDGLQPKREADRVRDDGVGGDNPRNRSNTAKVNHHPTVKPVALMRHLVRLVTPPGGTVLDPFAGSGTTLVAAILEGLDCIGIEMTDEYLPIIEGRTAWAAEQTFIRSELDKIEADSRQPTLLDE